MTSRNLVPTTEEDFLDVDIIIPGQNYVCLSFVSPEKFLPMKEVYKATKFLHYVFNNYPSLKDGCKPTKLNRKVQNIYNKTI